MKSPKTLIQDILQTGVLETTPGLQIEAYVQGKKKYSLDLGKTYDFYDLASVTKIIFGASLAMQIQQEDKNFLKTSVPDLLPWFPHKKIKIAHLLNHSSGLVWWKPFYKEFPKNANETQRWEILKEDIRSQKLETFGRSVYSDVGYITLGLAMEAKREKNFVALWDELKEKGKFPKGLHFNPHNKPKYARTRYAPTEKGTEKDHWRKKIIRGEVNDDNTWSLGGVSVHAGLFGSIEDLSGYGLLLRKALHGQKSFVNQKTAELFTERSIPRTKGDWGYGFVKPTKGSASCGPDFSLDSFGHLGFTGTSLWMDPKKDLLVTILSNRTWNGRLPNEFAKMRPLLHSLIVKGLDL